MHCDVVSTTKRGPFEGVCQIMGKCQVLQIIKKKYEGCIEEQEAFDEELNNFDIKTHLVTPN